jgi:hypothetical protein
MDQQILNFLPRFREILGLDEDPMGIFYTDEKPAEGFSPKPQAETIIQYISTGIPNWTEGEFYCDSPDELRRIFEYIDPRPAPKTFCAVKPVGQYSETEDPELISFFMRPESLSGIHQLAAFVTNDPEVVMSPWGAACGSLVILPLHYLSKGQNKAVIGGWDPSARKFFKTDELSFTVPFEMFVGMLNRFESSFLKTETWPTVQKKIARIQYSTIDILLDFR